MPVESAMRQARTVWRRADRSRALAPTSVCRREAPTSSEVDRADDTSQAHQAPCPERGGAAERWLPGWDSRQGGGQSVEWSFDTIPHGPLMARVGERVSDGRILELIEAFLHQDIVKGVERWTPVGGTPQGAVISPVLANVYLHPLDALMRENGYRMVRYADDFVVLCQTAEEAQAGLAKVQTWVEENGLTLNPDKTHVGDCREQGQGFDFLGYRFEAGQRWVRRKSMQAMRDRIRAKTGRTRGDSLAFIIAELNPMLRGWYEYFRHAHPWTYSGLDGFIRRRLRSLRRKQQKHSGTGRTLADHKRWPNAFFAELGLFTMTEAHALASQSR